MVRKKLGTVSICLAIIFIATLVVSGCARPAPTPTPALKPVPAPTPTPTAKPVPSPSPSPKPAYKLPDPIISASLDVGAGAYIIAAALGDAMKKERGVTLRVIPAGTDISRMSLMASRRSHLAWMGFGSHLVQEGVLDFATTEWGPQPVRIVYAGLTASGMLFATAKDANIKTYADLKGKRLSWILGYPAMNLIGDAVLAFGGLTWADVKKVDFPSMGATGKGIIEGKVDAVGCGTYSAFTYELAASPRGIHWPPYPHADEAGWKRLRQKVPMMYKVKATVGPTLSEQNPLESGTYPNPCVMVYDYMDNEFAYQLAKMIHELWPVYSKAAAPGMDQFDPERRIYDYVVPYHEGAIRYYKETGKWTDAAQKNNDRLLKRQQVLKEAWEKAVAQAAEKKIEAGKFPKFWETIRVESLKAADLEVYYEGV